MLLGLAALCVAAPGCGDGGSSPTYSVADVLDAFKERTGQGLVVNERRSTPRWDTLTLDEATPDTTAEQLGTFNVYVLKNGDAKRELPSLVEYTALLDEAPDLEPLDGITWVSKESATGPIWIGHRVYGRNVVLSYIADEKRAGLEFARVDTALRALSD